ncbi:MAG TPA: protein translocase subunit SecF [Spirochaetia bacterium]|nr:protein translocase subunit SecF [Spirochaetales bacterium]HRY79612.1 protein translocase subunit SecF [Spirochaetia bacterium]
MKRVIRFDRGFLAAVLLSVALIAFGIVGLATKGINLGVDFQAGINQYVQLVYPALDVSYSGTGNAVLSVSDTRAVLVFSGADVENRTIEYDLAASGTLSDLASAFSSQPGVSARVTDGAGKPAVTLVPTYQGDIRLAAAAVRLSREPETETEYFAGMDKVRAAAATIGSVSVQSVGERIRQQYIIRLRDDGTDPKFSTTSAERIRTALETAFGAGRVVVMKTDFVGARFSKDLADNAWKLTLFTVLAILAYATVRFKIQYAMGAVLAILHDALIMIAFIVWTRIEFNTSTLAAILTILGYSINDTIVIFDRIREDRRLLPTEPFHTVLNKSITETLGRTVITTITTMLAVLSIFFFTSGSIKDFALTLFVGMVSGTYSTIFIATAFVAFWNDQAEKRKKAQGTAPTAKKPGTAPVLKPAK